MSAYIFSRPPRFLLIPFLPICLASKPIWAGLLIFISWSSLSVAENTKIPAGPDPITKCERWAVPSWGDVVCLYGPGTDASLDSPEAVEKTFKRWKARGLTGVTLRTDLADFEPMIQRNNSTELNPRLQLLLDYVDFVSGQFNVIQTAQQKAEILGFKMWAWHPYIYSDGAPANIGTPGLGRMIPWTYCSKYFIEHPEGLTVDRRGNKLWMVREFAYPEARATKISEMVQMAKKLGLKRFMPCMRSEVNQLVDPPEKGDQYGFNPIVVDEMKKKHGVDIMIDPRFDVFSTSFNLQDPMVENWRKLRGEHITQFYRELRKALSAVDPKIQIAVTLSGEYAGPPLGNQRLDWRTWVDEGLIDAIVTPVFYEGSLDHDADKKGYLTNVRAGVGVVSLFEIKDYISKSKHPGIEVISTGATAYFDEPPPEGTDGWRCDMWYELYTSAWYQRWSQWMVDLKDLGAIRFIQQNFDTFPSDSSKLPPAGSIGLVNHDPKIRACPGGWYPFGNEASGKAFIQNTIRHGNIGNAVRITSNGAEGPTLTGYHNADADRSNISGVLDTSISNGTCSYSFWLYRETDKSGMITYLENSGGELDVGLKFDTETGAVSYTTGRGLGGTGTWVTTGYLLPVGEWQRFSIDVDFNKGSYSAHAGPNGETLLAENIPYSPPPNRTTSQNGVNIEIVVPSYKAFRQVLFQPLGPAGSKVDLDDVSVLWKPDVVFAPIGKKICFSDDFEQNVGGTDLHGLSSGRGGKWATSPESPGAFRVITSTSYREGEKSVLANRRGDLKIILPQPLLLGSNEILTFDADLFIRSDSAYPSIIPGQATSSPNAVSLIIERTTGEDAVLAEATATNGKWNLKDGEKFKESKTTVPYDCWMHVQLSVNMATRTSSLVQQQIGQVAQSLASAPIPSDFKVGMPLAFRLHLGNSSKCVVFDNVLITTGSKIP